MINKGNIEEKLFDYFEGNLSASEKLEVDSFIQQNIEYRTDFEAWQKSYLPQENFIYKHADDLLIKDDNSKKAFFGRWKTGLAMLLVASGLSYGIFHQVSQNDKKVISKGEVKPNSVNQFKKTINSVGSDNQNPSHFDNINSKGNIASSSTVVSQTNEVTEVKSFTENANEGNAGSRKRKAVKLTKNVNSQDINVNDPIKSISNAPKNIKENVKLAPNGEELKELKSKHSQIYASKKGLVRIAEMFKPTLNKRKSKFEKYDKNVVKFSNNKDPFFNIPNGSALDVNPSFVGNNKGIRVNYLYSNQWPELNDNNNFITQILSVDGYVKALKGGVGVLVNSDVLGHKKFTSQSVSFIYSPKFTLFGKTTIEPSLKYSYNKRSVTWNQLKTDELIDARTGVYDVMVVNNTNGVSSTTSTFSSFGTGLLLNTSKVYIGVAYDYWLSPSYNLDGYSHEIEVPGKLSAQFGGSIIPIKEKDFVLSPSVQYIKLGAWDNLWISNTFQLSKFFIGASVSANKESMFSAGYNTNLLRVSYAFSMTKSIDENSNLMSSHQVGVRFNFVPVKK